MITAKSQQNKIVNVTGELKSSSKPDKKIRKKATVPQETTNLAIELFGTMTPLK
jgi:hypothetical protein